MISATTCTTNASVPPTDQHLDGAERLGQRPGQQVADREQRERAHPVERSSRARARTAGCAPASVVSHEMSNIAKPKPTSTNSGATTDSGGPSANSANAAGQTAAEPIAKRIGWRGRQRSPTNEPMTVPAPSADRQRAVRRPRCRSVLATIVGPSVRYGASASSSASDVAPITSTPTCASAAPASRSRSSASSGWRAARSPRARGRTRASSSAETTNVARVERERPAGAEPEHERGRDRRPDELGRRRRPY